MPTPNSNNQQQNNNNFTDINNVIQSMNMQNASQTDRLLLEILKQVSNYSGATNHRVTSESQSSVSQDSKWKFQREGQESYRSRGNLLEDFENGIRDELLDSLAGGNFKKGIQSALSTFQEQFGFDLKNIGHEAGKKLTKNAIDAFSKSKFGQNVKAGISKYGNKALDRIFKNVEGGAEAKQGILNVLNSFRNGGQGGLQGGLTGAIQNVVGGNGGKAGQQLAQQAASNPMVQKAATGLAKAAAKMGPWGLLIAGIIVTAIKVLGPALQGLAEMAKALGKSFNREEELRKKRLENAQKRLKEDVDWLTTEPFKILQESVEKWTSTWDSNLRKIGQTQGYDKEAVYSLYESYADKLRSENLDAVINATDIVDKLSSVLDSGLSGRAAEEFAYAATKLNAAIPNQDFFQYAEVYASIAANAISQGKTQRQALDEANKQLEDFASNLLYSSRELAGGFSTGLQNGAELFKEAVQIAQTAKTYNATDISGTLTSVSAIIGAVAPDLANALVSNVVQAAVGGNSSQIVALRSLAGVNAGNTEFLRLMAENPKEIFTNLFTSLANMQNMSPDNYMEVAEGLADVFGIDKAAFARVDFNYLASAINSMNTNNRSLQDNLDLLVSGQTTTSAEQLKAQEINRVILDEGLAYVIDSEAGRMIQQHMWDEQRDNALMNATYAVDLQGSALSFLEGIRKTVTTLLNFLNPVGFIAKGIANMTATITEAIGNDQDIKEILKLGAVGSNSRAFYNLTTRGKDLALTTSLVEMMGGEKGIAALNTLTKVYNAGLDISGKLVTGHILSSGDFNKLYDRIGTAGLGIADNITGTGASSRTRYNWQFVGKSFAKALQNTPMNSKLLGNVITNSGSATQNAQAASNKRFQEFLDSAAEASKTMSYENWVATAKDRGISDFAEALKTYGRTEEEVRAYFESNQAQEGARQEVARKEDEQLFRDENRQFWDYANGNGIFQSAIWFPFFGSGQKYDVRMDAVDSALTNIQHRIGSANKHTVISGIEELSRKLGDDTDNTVISELDAIRVDISNTFVSTSSLFQRCLRDWVRYIEASNTYTNTVTRSEAWSSLQQAEKDQQTEATLALANALGVFSAEELKKMDPQLQANVLLGEIVVILQTIMQQNNSQAGGLQLIDTMSALGLGITK